MIMINTEFINTIPATHPNQHEPNMNVWSEPDYLQIFATFHCETGQEPICAVHFNLKNNINKKTKWDTSQSAQQLPGHSSPSVGDK
ncbi:hypothetical protein LENED_012357 [Lentinula edodes]|uniref:Uncharacterized protein n=1 Tax=Lentinula edodes TaxID=5353 RepID=A0A1Q3ESF3_LENED|nr:hypothetical protein LENED_012357 [Lentinula edodes]